MGWGRFIPAFGAMVAWSVLVCPGYAQVAQTPKAPLTISPRAKAFVSERWNGASFSQGVAIVADPQEAPTARALAMEKIFSQRRSISEAELGDFRLMLEKQMRSTSDDPYVVAASIRRFAGLHDYVAAGGLGPKADLAADGALLVSYLNNSALDLQVRGAAIRAVGDLGIGDGRKIIEAMLSNEANANTPEIARNGCLALVKLAGAESLSPIRGIFEKTTDPAVFGTAAFCLGQISNGDAMSALIKNAGRFPDSASCDAALVNMDKIILETLNRPDSPAVIDAIQATEHLWKEGQREKYIPALRGLLIGSPLAVKRSSCERLIDAASRLPFEQEKQELTVVLKGIGQTPELNEYAEKIRHRMKANVLVPTEAPSPASSRIPR